MRRGLSQVALAERAGIAQGHLSEIEKGIKSPSLQTLERICRVMSTSMADLIGEAEELTNQSLFCSGNRLKDDVGLIE